VRRFMNREPTEWQIAIRAENPAKALRRIGGWSRTSQRKRSKSELAWLVLMESALASIVIYVDGGHWAQIGFRCFDGCI